MRKVKARWIFRAAITMPVAFLAAFQAAAAQAITNTPICNTNQMTGQIDCGAGSDFFLDAGIALAIGLVFAFIYSCIKGR